MPSPKQILDALAAQLTTQLTGYDEELQIFARWLWMPSTGPAIDMYADETHLERHGMGSASFTHHYIVRARVFAADNEAQQDLLLQLMDPEGGASTSMWKAIESSDTLGGVVDDVTVLSSSGLGVFPPDDSMFGCTWTVQVLP